VVASTSGDNAVKALETFKGLRVIFVTHCAGFREPDTQEFTEENRKIVESKGGTIFTGTHLLLGLSRAMRNKYNMVGLGDIIADTLRTFGHGTKVACEIAIMAADAGLVRTDEDIITIAGRGHGSDTALVLTPVNSSNLFDLKVKEILCKPHL